MRGVVEGPSLQANESGEKSSDDFSLMQRIVARDQAALRELYDRYSSLVYTLALRILRDRSEADDLLTDVFWEVWDRAERFSDWRGAPRTYLVTLARSRSIDRLRSRRSRMAMVSDAVDPEEMSSKSAAPSAGSEQREERQIVLGALKELEPQQRQMIEYAFYDGLSHSDIAAKTNQPLGTVKTYIRRGLIRLRDSLRTLNRNMEQK